MKKYYKKINISKREIEKLRELYLNDTKDKKMTKKDKLKRLIAQTHANLETKLCDDNYNEALTLAKVLVQYIILITEEE